MKRLIHSIPYVFIAATWLGVGALLWQKWGVR